LEQAEQWVEVHLWVWAPAVQEAQELPLGQAQLAKKSMLAPMAREERIRVMWVLVGLVRLVPGGLRERSVGWGVLQGDFLGVEGDGRGWMQKKERFFPTRGWGIRRRRRIPGIGGA
jgi:hypothetical protein